MNSPCWLNVLLEFYFILFSLYFQEAGRSSLWSVNGPRILQVGYEDEEDPKVMEAYELVGSLVLHLILLLHYLVDFLYPSQHFFRLQHF